MTKFKGMSAEDMGLDFDKQLKENMTNNPARAKRMSGTGVVERESVLKLKSYKDHTKGDIRRCTCEMKYIQIYIGQATCHLCHYKKHGIKNMV